MKCICKHCRWLPERDTAKHKIHNWSLGEQRGRTPWAIKATKKICMFVDTKRNFLLLLLSCFTVALVPLLQVSPFPTLFNMRIKKHRIHLTTCCSISLNSCCWPFQRVQYHDPHFQKSLAFRIFHQFTVNSCSQHQPVPSYSKSKDEFIITTEAGWWLLEAKCKSAHYKRKPTLGYYDIF